MLIASLKGDASNKQKPVLLFGGPMASVSWIGAAKARARRVKREAPKEDGRLTLAIAVPAFTTIVTLLLGAGINAIISAKLERQKFEFQVMSYVLSSGKDAAERTRLLCEFSEQGFIKDPDRRYHRFEINGSRPCRYLSNPPTGEFNLDDRHRQLAAQLGAVNKILGGSLSIEDGFLKADGRVGPLFRRKGDRAKAQRITGVAISTFESEMNWNDVQDVTDDARANSYDFIVDRDGSLRQLRNIYVNPNGAVSIGLLNYGELVPRPGKNGETFNYFGKLSGGRVYDRGDVNVVQLQGGQTRAFERYRRPQLSTLASLVGAICMISPAGLSLYLDSDTREAFARQIIPIDELQCNPRLPIAHPAESPPDAPGHKSPPAGGELR
jgi:hypothetical protein